MRKVQIIGPKNYLDECVRALHAAAVVHIETGTAGLSGKEFLTRLPMEKDKLGERAFLDKAAERLKNLIALLKPPETWRPVRVGGEEIRKLLEEVSPIEEKVKGLHARLDELLEESSTVNRYERLLKGFAPIVSRLGGLKNFDIVGLTIEKTREDVSGLLDAEVARITEGAYQIYMRELDDSTIGIVLTYPREFESKVRYLLTGKAISEVKLPDEYAELPLISALKLMSRRKAELPGLIREVERELGDISWRWYGTLQGLYRAVEDSIDEIGVLSYASQSRFAFVIEGWVPVTGFEGLKERFAALFGDKVLIRALEIEEREMDLVPVCIKNPRILKPFEVFLGALPAPRYGSVDPTIYVAVFFPAFWGLIVADIGYGFVILLVSLYLKRRFRDKATLRDLASVLVISSLPAIAFGFLFGEFFGDLGERLGFLHPVILDRIKALKTLMVLTLGIGIGHILLGIVIGAVNRLMRGHAKEAAGKAFYFISVASFLAVMGIAFGYLPKGLFTPGLVVLAASFIALTVIEGVLGPLEFIKALGNIISYMRLMAVGTASVVMALVANRIGSLSDNLVVGVIVAGLLHALNLLLSVLSPSIQSMRLQYVEFFSKFYEGGGRRYSPFRKR